MSLRVGVVTLFPEMITDFLRYGVTGRAVERGLLTVTTWNPRDYAEDGHGTVDDRPYGGGPGMVMKVAPLRGAIESARAALGRVETIHLSPQGRRFEQAEARELSGRCGLILVAGRYEGVDERLLGREIDSELSIGDYVLSGGEPAAMVVIDALARLLPGALGDAESAQRDSFSEGLLDWPQYTRPEVLDERRVPEILLSGDHEAIRRWRLKQALGRTWLRRPEMLDRAGLSGEQRILLAEFIREHRRREHDGRGNDP